ncbi:type I-G CRISPR-associated helicase/endonuclease Cas3g [Sorangium sp. So ce233]|uniref:type I-G CRISPR-associated helicase/endonuclease Cas3g n=1 Tax=Sorangium sp. So ce233 TaxID=3133290 RepID=UPI003F5F2509
MSSPPPYAAWFQTVAGFSPHGWQRTLGEAADCTHRLLRIPTGFGKTAGVVLPWLYHRVLRQDLGWPTRLVFCFPMRTLVEQTEAAIAAWLARSGLPVSVHVLMGGVEAQRWELAPEQPAILLGTQDMLLSRAMNRGYGTGRARWPMTFGLVSQDALWVLDELQLMDVGLATSAQLAAFRDHDAAARRRLRPAVAWWMSATLQPGWLRTVDFGAQVAALDEQSVRIPEAERQGGLWDVRKSIELRDAAAEADVAKLALDLHQPGTLSLVVVNQVQRAVDLFQALDERCHERKGKTRVRRPGTPELKLVHSRFRGAERAQWSRDFLSRAASRPEALPGEGRIVVATQVVEAGVDISARLLITDLAPWSSLVQRFGRCARYEGESGVLVVLGRTKTAAPYAEAELDAAAEAVAALARSAGDASPRAVDAFEQACAPDLLGRLYRYAPAHVLRRRDIDELFDTTPDLTGSDLDVGRYIRSGDDRDVRVFWRPVEPQSKAVSREHIGRVHRAELCPVPIRDLRDFARADRGGRPVFALDYVLGAYRRVEDVDRIPPGSTLLLPLSAGGYSADLGWNPKASAEVAPFLPPGEPADGAALRLDRSAEAAEDDSLSQAAWKSIATHGRETAEALRDIADALRLPARTAALLDLAARWHDAGKAHEVFQEAIAQDARSKAGELGLRRDLAKAPGEAWTGKGYPTRPGFRHELASALALLALLRRAAPLHAALLGGSAELLAALGEPPPAAPPEEAVDGNHPLARELAELSEEELNLVAFLVCAHHGKVRTAWTSTPLDQAAGHGGIHGVCEDDALGSFELAAAEGDAPVPSLTLSLEPAALGVGARFGASWGERIAGLLEAWGPFTLAYLEALLRAADVRASMDATS